MNNLTIERVYDEYGRAQSIISIDDLVLSLDGHSVDLTDKRLKPLWNHINMIVNVRYKIA